MCGRAGRLGRGGRARARARGARGLRAAAVPAGRPKSQRKAGGGLAWPRARGRLAAPPRASSRADMAGGDAQAVGTRHYVGAVAFYCFCSATVRLRELAPAPSARGAPHARGAEVFERSARRGARPTRVSSPPVLREGGSSCPVSIPTGRKRRLALREVSWPSVRFAFVCLPAPLYGPLCHLSDAPLASA